jgi:hypothetical protein
MGFGIIALIALRLLSPSVLPVRTPSIPISFSSLPLPTVIGALLSIVAIAGVTEEMAFRGYMQRPLEETYGIVPAVLIVGIMFWVAHLDHGITLTHLPFQMSASIALGLLAYATRSLVPGMNSHAAGDFLHVPVYFFHQPEFAWKALSARPIWEGVASTFSERLLSVFSAMAPKNIFVDGPFKAFAVIAWVLVLSAALTIFTFVRLLRVSRASTAELHV